MQLSDSIMVYLVFSIITQAKKGLRKLNIAMEVNTKLNSLPGFFCMFFSQVAERTGSFYMAFPLLLRSDIKNH